MEYDTEDGTDGDNGADGRLRLGHGIEDGNTWLGSGTQLNEDGLRFVGWAIGPEFVGWTIGLEFVGWTIGLECGIGLEIGQGFVSEAGLIWVVSCG